MSRFSKGAYCFNPLNYCVVTGLLCCLTFRFILAFFIAFLYPLLFSRDVSSPPHKEADKHGVKRLKNQLAPVCDREFSDQNCMDKCEFFVLLTVKFVYRMKWFKRETKDSINREQTL